MGQRYVIILRLDIQLSGGLGSNLLTWGPRVQVVLKSANKDDSNLAREIHHHRQFIHPHIARLYEVIVTESLVWLVLEYCPGMLISRAISRA
jgi:serine/threonine protein kinase